MSARARRVPSVSWPQVLSWRLAQQLLEPRGTATAPDVARSIVGIQAQVASAAELAVAVRQRTPTLGEVDRALWTDRTLVKTWAMRGTLHLLPSDEADTIVGTLARLRPWESSSWQKYHGIGAAEVDRVCEAIATVLGPTPLTREELSSEIAEHVRSNKVGQKLGSGWSELLKPAAFQGLLLQGPPRDRSVTFVAPRAWLTQWKPPDPDEAGAALVRSYLHAHGPATLQHFATWWARQRAAVVRPWFQRLGDEFISIEVEGTESFMLAKDLDALRRRKPSRAVRLLPNFDQYILASGRSDEAILPAKHRARVSRQAGWISKVVLLGGRVAGVWELDEDGGGLDVELFESVPPDALRKEARHLGGYLGREFVVRTRRVRT